ncbi:hypothetical protein C1H76_8943 [Elsinoe australis]|uniref:Vacuolar ATPase assembly protein VMA22 n=1 Tax=Elsinoe australis TaxID=40998 RepID=A0A4V6DT35_9PEZI|nr:hypothetical protein C1H76_8943 [Elsinoe australis]
MEDAKQQLESLWIKYLGFLDQYSKAQQEISKHHSSGIFSLAEANFKNTTRTRYGQDYYDERMQAATRCSVSGSSTQMFALDRDAIPTTSLNNDHARNSEQQPTDKSEPSGSSEKPDANESVPEKTIPSKDPLRWFGILVQPQLRSCQRSFLGMVTGPVLEAVNASRSLRQLEVEIRRLRKDIRKAERASKTAGADAT